ncbi:MAG: RluA family pseudouridine synthase [Blastocatellia bacterium]
MPEFSFTIASKGMRFDQYLALQFPSISLTRIRNAIRAGAAQLNARDTTPGWILQPGDKITLTLDPGEPSASTPENIPLDILHEDADLLVINKQTGLLSHPSHNEKSGTLMNAIAWHFLHNQTPGAATERPTLLHRLDRDTSGVIAIAKNDRASRIVTKAFRQRRVTKQYLALVHGSVTTDEGMIDAPLGRNPDTWPRWCVREGGEPSQTGFRVRRRFAHHTLLELNPLTGRTHQLRIHCAHIGHPIVGDPVYKGSVKPVETPGVAPRHQLLHAHLLGFRHPTGGADILFTAPLPAVMDNVIRILTVE